MARKVVFDRSVEVAQWVADRVDETHMGDDATGIGLEQDGVLVAGVAFNRYTETDIHMHVAIDRPRAITKEFVTCCFAFPFIQLGVNRVTGLVRSDNLPAQRFDEHLGFKREGLIRQACDDGTDLIVYGMLRSECKWIRKEQKDET